MFLEYFVECNESVNYVLVHPLAMCLCGEQDMGHESKTRLS